MHKRISFPHGRGVKVMPPSASSGSEKSKVWESPRVSGRVQPESENGPTLCVLTGEDFILGGTYEDLEVFFSSLLDTLHELKVVELQEKDSV